MADFDHRILFVTIYAAFNARAIDEVLVNMHPDVDWPNGWEGGWVKGHDAVRDYWTRQWNVVNPRVEPLRCETDVNGQIVVDVHQVVKDLSGTILADGMVQHVYQLEDGLIRRMEIREV
ncbi:nuclear transport factor 2 family protein [Spirosoma sp. KCTC 42546]|uniref:nuclear transport factor 2 family protein n=1 Tax=Spirosoma sp. KCTC 42546 TaxID=2520506 RepID=UPI00115B3066|nr:nuclear transport factor 2 family protein [Spirosoma sp. KCTC 42546]QDK79567.1 nuclear transport factor 2 family protein [Spirosoma sp. KCTC 42546]